MDGEVETGLLDLGRAQRLARLEPLIDGEAALQGTFAWEPPRLSSRGRLEAPLLAYDIAGRRVRLQELTFPAFQLELVTAPATVLELSPGADARIGQIETTLEDHTVTAAGFRLAGTLRYADAAELEFRDVDYRAERLGWQSGGRQVAASDVRLNGQVLQRLDGADPFPSLHAGLSASSLAYGDPAAETQLQFNAVALDDFTLAPGDAKGRRPLAGRVTLGQGQVTQADTRLDWSSVSADLGGAVGEAVHQLTAELALSGLSVPMPLFANGPLEIAAVTASGLELGAETGLHHLRAEGIALPAALPETALRIAAVDLAEGRYDPSAGVAVEEIVIDGLQTGVIRDKSGVWQYVLSGAPGAEGPAGAAKGEAPAWRLGGLRVTGDSRIAVADRTNPDMRPLEYRVERIEVGALSSAAPDADTPFDIALRPDRYSEFVIAGKVRPLAERLHLDAEGHLHGFGLTSVNGLVANDLGHRFLEGQLDNDFRISVAKDRLDMGNALAIAGVAVEEIPGREGPPLGTAIALLEDPDGNIRLEVPVAGDLADPEFRVLGALNPIIMKAVAGTAALAIQPLGSVLLVGGLLADQALKVTFEPALFEPGGTELDAAAQKYLGQLAAKLAEKAKLAVRVCGVAADMERKRDKKGEYLDQEADLLALAQQRADTARTYLAGHGAAARQLRTCRPRLDPDQSGRPRVDIRF